MDDRPIEWTREGYVVSTDRSRLDLAAVLELLRDTHWGHALTGHLLRRAVENSVCFGLYAGAGTVGFGRVVTDLATYGYLTDMVVAPGHRHRGLGGWLTECMVAHPELQGFRRMALLTRDAEAMYSRVGFTRGAAALVYMERR
jgi:ribosomal protein S18 acetylase RimI-like enzyme